MFGPIRHFKGNINAGFREINYIFASGHIYRNYTIKVRGKMNVRGKDLILHTKKKKI